jgi:CRP/FNR family transcriptional regulator, anaerobic regulatory protein
MELKSDVGLSVPPTFAPGASEHLLTGGRLLRRAFLATPVRLADRDAVIVAADDREPPALLIRRGVAYRSFTLSDGRRAIVDILLPGDFAGIDHAVLGRSNHDIIAASTLGYRLLSAAALRELMADPQITLRALAVMGEARWRSDRHMTAVIRFDAHGRIAAFLLGMYDRLRRRELISRPTFNLPLTQEQMADHLGLTMVHVSRTMRRLREERLVLMDRHVVIIFDLDGLRRVASGLPPLNAPEISPPIESAE